MLALAYEHPRSKQTVQIRQAVGIARDQPFKLRIGEQALPICLGVTPSGGSEGNINAVELGLTRAAGGDVTEVRLVAEAADAGAGPWPQRDAALDGGPEEAGQDRRDFGERVRRRRVVGGLQLPAGEQSPDSGADGGEDVRCVLVARHPAWPVARIGRPQPLGPIPRCRRG